MWRRLIIAVIAVGLLALFFARDASRRRELQQLADFYRAQSDSLTEQLAEVSSRNDSLRIAVDDAAVAYSRDSTRWSIADRAAQHQAQESGEAFTRLVDQARGINDPAVAIMLDSIQAQHETVVAAYEERIAIKDAEIGSLRVQVGELRAFASSLEDEIVVQRDLVESWQTQAETWQSIANPPLLDRLRNAIPSASIGAGLLVVGLIALK